MVERLAAVKETDGSYRYSLLVFDNRGVGNSGYPQGPYRCASLLSVVVLILIKNVVQVGWQMMCCYCWIILVGPPKKGFTW